jgi:hypothetical protein
MQADYAGAALELRRFGSFGSWQRACVVPCDRRLMVSSMEVRVVAPGMTPSKPFRIEPGSGSALLSVDGGSAASMSWGKRALFASIAPTFLGMGLYGLGAYDERDELKIGGGILLGLGTALVLTALPLMVSGSTEVENQDGDLIGRARASSLF